ncbi:unnamed protein product [Lathyrus oleraceus]|nr:uncharacterized protein LOC127075944 [Pisum sativum]
MKKWIPFSSIILIVFVTSSFILEIDFTKITSGTILKTIEVFNNKQQPQFPLNCNVTTCSSNYPTTFQQNDYPTSSPSCPQYFKWIHEDLKPWEKTGITREMVESGQNLSHFRLVIVNGKLYIEKFAKAFQTRDVFTIWGIIQLLRLYPGKIPDLELMFQCGDKTVVEKRNFQGSDVSPPPVFHYCGKENYYDIVFPDWTFWGWAELHIRPWETTLHNIQEGNKNVKWEDRVPYAYWKGNPSVSSIRKELVKCNASDGHDWNARIFGVHWKEEKSKSFNDTKLENQCTYRYKIYAEGATWSVSEKYIIACDSMTMFIEPRYYDFFTRSMLPLQHYWPISAKNMCEEIKFAVDWGNTHLDSAQLIGEGGTKYVTDNLKMKFVYDYMFHQLSSYAKLLRFEPKIPEGGVEVCAESMACSLRGARKHFLVESMVVSPSDAPPCTMPSPYTSESLQQFLQAKEELIRQVKTRVMNKKL